MSVTATYPFVAIVLALREAGMNVSVGDLLDGINALVVLEEPFVALEPVSTSPEDRSTEEASTRRMRREKLIWLVQALWARSDEERQIVRRVLGQDIAPPPTDRILELGQVIAGLPTRSPNADTANRRSVSDEPLEDLTAKARRKEENKGSKTGKKLKAESQAADIETPEQDLPAVRVPVPVIKDTGLGETSLYQMTARLPVDELTLAAVWRRYRHPRLVPDRKRIDAEKTVQATIRAGDDLTIMHAKQRVNNAKLAVLFDVSSAMAPWETWRSMLCDTVDPKVSRIEEVEIGYFATIPGGNWYDNPALTLPKNADDMTMAKRLKDMSQRPLFVFGEAGAARAPTSNMTERLRGFLKLTQQNDIRPLVWINPMRKSRWQPEFQNAIQSAPHAEAYEMSHQSLMDAIDKMRELAP